MTRKQNEWPLEAKHSSEKKVDQRPPGERMADETAIDPPIRAGEATDVSDGRPRRRNPKRPRGEYLRSHDVARILPFSLRQIEAMAAQGTLPAFKIPGCAIWLFDEAAIRRNISTYV